MFNRITCWSLNDSPAVSLNHRPTQAESSDLSRAQKGRTWPGSCPCPGTGWGGVRQVRGPGSCKWCEGGEGGLPLGGVLRVNRLREAELPVSQPLCACGVPQAHRDRRPATSVSSRDLARFPMPAGTRNSYVVLASRGAARDCRCGYQCLRSLSPVWRLGKCQMPSFTKIRTPHEYMCCHVFT